MKAEKTWQLGMEIGRSMFGRILFARAVARTLQGSKTIYAASMRRNEYTKQKSKHVLHDFSKVAEDFS